jgi:hypothetical protein
VTTEPTLADDEGALARIAADLGEALGRLLPEWMRRRALGAAAGVDPEALAAAIAAAMGPLVPELERVLTADVDAGAGSPLAAVRAATGPLTSLLLEHGAEPTSRDAFDARAFPDDVFGFGPASFADIDESLHELGLMWGAARAHVHLRRRREATQ